MRTKGGEKAASGQTVNAARSADSHQTVIRKGHNHNANVCVCVCVCVCECVCIKMWIN